MRRDPNRSTRARRAVVLVALLGLVAAACGDDDGSTGAEQPGGATVATTGEARSSSSEATDVDEDGVLRVAVGLLPTNASTQWDPTTMVSPAGPTHELVYGSLLRQRPDGTVVPDLAVSAEVVDPRTVTIELREGVVFSDGTPFDAAAVKAGIERNLSVNNQRALDAELYEVESITVDGPLSLTVHLRSPIAGSFYTLLFGRGATTIVSPKAVADGVDLAKTPVGAGPYLLESLDPEDRMVLVKNPDYWDAEHVRIPRVEFVHAEGPEATVNALRSRTVDASGASLTPEVVNALTGSHLRVEEQLTESTLFWGQLCKSRPPFDDVRVRMAMNLALDRDGLNQALYDGISEPMWGFWPAGSPYHDPALDGFYERDLDRARALLAEAGYPDGFAMEAVVPSTGGVGLIGTEIIQAQFAEVGIDLTIVRSSNLVQQFFVENLYPVQFFTLQNPDLKRITRTLVGNNLGNICQWNHAGLNDLVAQLQAVPHASDEAIELWKQLDRLALEEAMNIFGIFGTYGNAWDESRLGDVDFVVTYQGIPWFDVRGAYIKEG